MLIHNLRGSYFDLYAGSVGMDSESSDLSALILRIDSLALLFGYFSYDTIIAFHMTPQIALEGIVGTLLGVLCASFFSVIKMLRIDSIDLCRDLT